jgi:hypothetical protein
MTHNQGHHHHGECCSKEGECCHSEDSCGAHHHHHHECCGHHEHEDFSEQLIEMADEAWMEVLKCKIKEHINNSSGSHLDELAKIVSESNHCRWKHKMAGRKGIDTFKHKVRDFFNRGS